MDLPCGQIRKRFHTSTNAAKEPAGPAKSLRTSVGRSLFLLGPVALDFWVRARKQGQRCRGQELLTITSDSLVQSPALCQGSSAILRQRALFASAPIDWPSGGARRWQSASEASNTAMQCRFPGGYPVQVNATGAQPFDRDENLFLAVPAGLLAVDRGAFASTGALYIPPASLMDQGHP